MKAVDSSKTNQKNIKRIHVALYRMLQCLLTKQREADKRATKEKKESEKKEKTAKKKPKNKAKARRAIGVDDGTVSDRNPPHSPNALNTKQEHVVMGQLMTMWNTRKEANMSAFVAKAIRVANVVKVKDAKHMDDCVVQIKRCLKSFKGRAFDARSALTTARQGGP